MAPGMSEGRRHEIIGMLRAGMSVKEVMKMAGVARSTVFLIKKNYQKREGDLSRKKGQGRPASVVSKDLVDKVRKRRGRPRQVHERVPLVHEEGSDVCRAPLHVPQGAP